MSDNFFNVLDRLVARANPLSTNTDYQQTINTIDSKLQSYSPNNNTDRILTAQSQMIDVMNKETDYLNNRDEMIKKDIATGERMMQLNDSNRKRYYQYVMIVMIWVGTITVLLLLIYLKRIFSDFPFNFFFLLTITIAVLWTTYILYTISQRDPTDFDKLYLIPPEFKSYPSARPISSGSTDLQFDANGNCIGEYCCVPGETYVKNDTYPNGKCLIDTNIKNNFQNMSDGFENMSDGFENKRKEGFTAIGDLLGAYPPNLGANLFPFYSYNYACEGDDYCTYNNRDNNFI